MSPPNRPQFIFEQGQCVVDCRQLAAAMKEMAEAKTRQNGAIDSAAISEPRQTPLALSAPCIVRISLPSFQ
jgi:hypothetical protein